MNNNQGNQAMGVLGGMTGFTPVANMADGTAVIAALLALNTKVGSGTLSTTAQNLVAAVNELLANQGTLSSLSTTAKNTLVAAINEVAANLATLGTSVAALPTVAFKDVEAEDGNKVTATGAASTLEIDGVNNISTKVSGGKVVVDGSLLLTIASAAATYLTQTSAGSLSDLATTDKSSLVGAVNDVFASAGTALSAIGTMANLYGGYTDLVTAINKLDQRVAALEA